MSFLDQLSSLFGSGSNYEAEYKRFKKAMARNPFDQGLKAQFIKFCLLNRFTGHEPREDHIAEALRLFDGIEKSENLDLQCHYLVGKYYQENKDPRTAYGTYLDALKRFNRAVARNPAIKTDNLEMAYSISLNLLNLQSHPVDPEVEQCFRILRKSFPLHLKRIEYENERAKPAPDPGRVKELAGEIRRLKEEEDKDARAVAGESAAAPSDAPSNSPKAESKGLFSKLFSELSPSSAGLSGPANVGRPADGRPADGRPAAGAGEEAALDFFKLSPLALSPDRVSAFLAFHDDHWQGPYTPEQLHGLGFLKPGTWVCRQGSQQVIQAYEAPDLRALVHRS